jgi:cytochrome c556
MKRTMTAVACYLTLLAVATGAGLSDNIETIMEKGFKKGGLRHQMFSEIEKDKPDWSGVQHKAKAFQALCDQLGKQTPPKGESQSWKTHTQYVGVEAKTLSECATQKDQAKVKAALQKINASCTACHEAHRE